MIVGLSGNTKGIRGGTSPLLSDLASLLQNLDEPYGPSRNPQNQRQNLGLFFHEKSFAGRPSLGGFFMKRRGVGYRSTLIKGVEQSLPERGIFFF
jgi:hypothetical protein